ncbi:Uncharacterised protein [Moraxella ovis]|nr:Uncharacterised protein [Moraxella ovis]STZ06210.1 Uncharacterised protein [Moraxella ovis]
MYRAVRHIAVRHIDVIIARSVLELIIYFVTFVILILVLHLVLHTWMLCFFVGS